MENKHLIFIMGVSGSGKTSVGILLAKELNVPFIDADDHHPASNIDKMSRGIPLTDLDRIPWLDKLNHLALEHIKTGCVMACSALKNSYRDRLSEAIHNLSWVYLKGDYDLIFKRMQQRKGHFMDPEMLKSQFEVLEEPRDSIEMKIEDSPNVIVEKIKNILR